MAQTIRQITVRKGIDPRECALIAFGGAGAQHAAEVASILDIREVVIPAHASVLSAVGLMTAPLRIISARTLLLPVSGVASPDVATAFDELAADAVDRLGHVGGDEEALLERFIAVRYIGQWHELTIPFDADPTRLTDRFEDEHERLYGTRLGDPLEIVEVSVALTVAQELPETIWRVSKLERAPDERYPVALRVPRRRGRARATRARRFRRGARAVRHRGGAVGDVGTARRDPHGSPASISCWSSRDDRRAARLLHARDPPLVPRQHRSRDGRDDDADRVLDVLRPRRGLHVRLLRRARDA